MKEVTFIFVNTQTSLPHKLVGWLINGFQHSVRDFASHVAIQFKELKGHGPCIVESIINRGVQISTYEKYDNDKNQCKITVCLSDAQYDIICDAAIEVVTGGFTYSYKACILGGIANSINRKLARLLAKLLRTDMDNHMNCSEAATFMWRRIYSDFCQGLSGSEITPYDFFINLLIDNIFAKINITNITEFPR